VAVFGGPATAASPGPGTLAPVHIVEIEVRGAAALVTVTRTLPGVRRAGDAREDILDLSLPPEAHLLDMDVDASGRFETPLRAPDARARDGYVEAARSLGLTPRALSFDDEATLRVRIALKQQKPNQNTIVRYQFSTLVHVVDRRAELVFPATPDAPAPPARVTVRADVGQDIADISIAGSPHVVARGGHATAMEPSVPTDHRWTVSLGLERDPSRPAPSRFTALAAHARQPAGSTSLACAIGLSPGPPQTLPDRVLFVIDRSRSVGPGGLEAERDVAKRILLALPPSTMFDALFFDRARARLFPAPRTATRQALGALEDEMVTARLANGTDLRAALRATGDLLRHEAAAFGPRTLVVILSDGAVGALSPADAKMVTRVGTGVTTRPAGAMDFVGELPGVDLMLAALSIRPNDDPPVSPDERRTLRAIAASASQGGVEREIRVGDIEAAVPGALDALRVGGDVFAVRVGTRDASEALAPAIGPGEGATGIVSLKSKATAKGWVPASLMAMSRAETRSVPLHTVGVEARWLSGESERSAAVPRLFVGPALAALVEPVIRPGPEAETAGPSGYLGRSVVRDALSLAFTPRARACYLNRTAATPADRDLAGRVRLALDFVRGEVNDARVESSTLRRPAIEDCLREGAFALDVPRAYRNDERVTAILNLVFRARTPERQAPATDPKVSHEIDLLVEGALKPSPSPEAATGPPDAGAPKAPTDAGPE
jgi:hypothetical protein